MGWIELRGWLREMNRSRLVDAKQYQADPDSWDGAENDSFWAEQRAKQDRMRGR